MSTLTILHPIEAWRYWYVCRLPPASEIDSVSSQYGLMSTGLMILWFPRKAKRAICSKWGLELCKRKEVCNHGNFNIPIFHGTCGIYGYRSKEIALRKISKGSVLGKVALWGKIIEHDDGSYRAKWAYPLGLEFGICFECGDLVPLSKSYLMKFYTGIRIFCEFCFFSQKLSRYLRMISPPGWHRLVAEEYGISIGV